jgi:antitoxin component YwqK of YwqJK toxin-antitoxin module
MLQQAYAQQTSAKYMEQSIDGYIHLYFDQQYYLVDKNCVYKTFTRVIKYDKNDGGFNSFFTDYYNNNQSALTGKYQGGKKQGEFKGFYENGIPKFTINFKDNLPIGDWKYFYPSGNIWLNLAYKNGQIFIKSYFDEKGRQQIKDGKGILKLIESVYDFNEFGYTGISFEGRVKDGKPEGIWSSNLVYSRSPSEYIGVERFEDGKFKISNYNYPKNFSPKSSIVKFHPVFTAENAQALTFKNCTIDDNQGYNFYLQNYLNSTIIFERSDVLPQEPFEVKLDIDNYGKVKNVNIPEGLDLELTNVLKQVLLDVPYFIPSYINGKTISDILILKLSILQDNDNRAFIGYPDIKRTQGK